MPRATTKKVDTENNNQEVQEVKVQKKKVTRFENHEIVYVKSNTRGVSFVNPNTGSRYEWKEAGTELELYVEDVVCMRQSFRGYFEKNWITILEVVDHEDLDQEEVYKILRLQDYYNVHKVVENFAEVLQLSVNDLTDKIKSYDAKNKQLFANYVLNLTEDQRDELSMKVIKILKKELGIDF